MGICVSSMPNIAHATVAFEALPVFARFLSGGVNAFIADVGYLILTFTSTLVMASGVFLSISINITTHIKDIYATIPGINSIWITIRDLSSIFIIFALLYIAIKMILSVEGANFGSLVAKVFIAGVLINFSMFFVKIAVDASNLVSLQFYNAIAPNTGTNFTVSKAFNDGGLSNVFLQSLKVQKIYDKASVGKKIDIGAGIIFSIVGGIILMVVAAFSFFAAAIAFTARTAIILGLMAVSPLYFAGYIFPKLKSKLSDPLFSILKAQCIFMPVYLLLMYVALRIISDPGFNSIFGQGVATAKEGDYAYVWTGIIIQYVIAIIFINLPLLVAIKLGSASWVDVSKTMSWAPNAATVGRKLRSWTGSAAGATSGFVGRKSIGALGSKVDKWAADTSFGNSKMGRIIRGATTEKAANAKFGSSKSRKDVEKLEKEIAKKDREIDKVDMIKAIIGSAHPKKSEEVKKVLDKMTDSEIANLDKEILTNGDVVPHLSSTVFKNVEKGEKKEEDKIEISKARIKTFANAVIKSEHTKIAPMMKNMSGEEITEILTEQPALAKLDNFVEYLKPNHLKNMENVKPAERLAIGNIIRSWHTTHFKSHPAWDHVDKNATMWS